MSDRELIVANMRGPHRFLRDGGKVEILFVPGDPKNIKVRGLSHGGRKVVTWVRINQLEKARVKRRPQDLVESNLHGRTPEFVAKMINAGGNHADAE